MPTQGRFRGCGFVLGAIGIGLMASIVLVTVASRLAPSEGDSPGRESRETNRSASSYTVQPGDTLSSIAARHRTTVAALATANGIADADQIEVGQQLRVDGKARPASAKPKPRLRTRPAAPKPRPKPTRKRSPVEEPDALIADDMSDVMVESLVALVRLRGYRCDSVSGAVPSVFRAGRFTLNCNQFRYAYVIEDRGGHWVVRVK
ncbi:MAG: LysM peptidoglycan-binding domain-containing protein [Acidobacteria bacterium]|nr:LysM peptidoglycan-binding domain-containing protein [Acidobacteriota bacterium]